MNSMAFQNMKHPGNDLDVCRIPSICTTTLDDSISRYGVSGNPAIGSVSSLIDDNTGTYLGGSGTNYSNQTRRFYVTYAFASPLILECLTLNAYVFAHHWHGTGHAQVSAWAYQDATPTLVFDQENTQYVGGEDGYYMVTTGDVSTKGSGSSYVKMNTRMGGVTSVKFMVDYSQYGTPFGSPWGAYFYSAGVICKI